MKLMYTPQHASLSSNLLTSGLFKKKKIVAMISCIMAFCFLSNQLQAQCRLLNENFNSSPVLAPTNTDGAWYPDRYPPAGFTDDAGRLKISISLNDGAQLRPVAFSGQFYNTQGRKFNQCGKCVTVLKGQVYIPADWATKKRRTDMWATAFNVADAVSFYPIIGFRNADGVSPGIYYWNGVALVNSGVAVTYDTWTSLEFRLAGANVEYLVNNVVVATIPANASVYFGDIIMQAYNFNDNTLGAFYDNTADATYDAFWDNLVTTGTGGKVVTNTNTGQTFCTIQSAIDAPLTTNGHSLQVSGGIYNEKVVVSKQLTIEGAGEGITVVEGAGLGTGSGIYINNGITNVTLRFMTIRNHAGTSPNSYAGIYAVGGNNNLTVEHVTLKDNVGGSGFYANGPISNVLLDDLDVSGHTGGARGIVIWNGFKQNITITNSDVYNNNCCGIELQDGTASGVTMSNNNVHDNADNGLAAIGLKEGAGPTVIANNTVVNNGRFGIEIKNPKANGTAVGDGSVVIQNNTVNFTAAPGMNNRDHAGISVYRRAFEPGNPSGYPDFPSGVVITGNSVSGYKQQNPLSVESKGYGIVVEGIRHTVTGNTLTNNDVGIQEQGGAHPNSNYVPNDAGDGNQSDGFSANYFGRGNAPIACGNTLAPNTFVTNTTNSNSVTANSFGLVQNTNTGLYYCSIQAAINDPLTLNGHTIVAAAATYDEDVTVNKSLTITGAGMGSTTIRGPIGGPGSTVTIAANNVNISGFTITRAGNNLVDWNNPGLNSAGIAIQGLAITGANIHDNKFDGNRTGIDINNSGGHTIFRNDISNNRTGLIFRNQTDNISFTENFVKDNWTVGILFLDASGGTNSPLQQALGSTFRYNNISGNWYGQVVDRQSGGSLPAPGTTNLKAFKCNWWGTTSPVVTTANSAEPGYAAQIPVAYGGAATAPGGQPDIAGPASANIKYLPLLIDGTDANLVTNGFQAVAGSCVGCNGSGALVTNTNTGEVYCSIQEAVDDPLTLSGHIISASAGTYNEQVVIDGKNLTIQGAGAGTIIRPSSAAILTSTYTYPAGTFWPGTVMGSIIIVKNATVTLKDFTVDGVNITSVPAGTTRLAGILYGEAGGVIDNVDVTTIKTTGYADRTSGIDISAVGSARNVEIKNSGITDWSRSGILVQGASMTANIHDNVLTGPGTIGPANVPNGITFIQGPGGIIKDNTLSAMHHTGTTAKAAALLFYNPLTPGIIAEENSITDADDGVIFGLNSNGVIVRKNYILQTEKGIQFENGSTNNSILNNIINNSSIAAIHINGAGNASTPPGSGNVAHENDLGLGNVLSILNHDNTKTFDAECNWFGTTGAGVASKVAGVGTTDYLPFLNNGTDVGGDPTDGFQPVAGSCSGCLSGSVQNTNTLEYFCSIQEAINDAQTLNGHTIVASAGTYKENVIVNKELTILGPNALVNPCSGVRVAEAIVMPATANISAGEIFHVAASNVTISGFTIDGDNPSLTSGATSTTAADIDAADGITVYETNINNLHVSNNIIKNLSYFGVSLYDWPAGVPTSGHVIENNQFMDMGTYGGNSYDYWGGGVLIYNNAYTAISNNCMQNVRIGVQTGNFHLANPGAPASQVISGNTMSVRRRGIFHNLQYGSASPLTLQNNQVTGIANANETFWDGMLLSSLSVPSNITGNTVNGSGISTSPAGIVVWNVGAATPANISGGSLTNLNKGLFVNNYDGYPSTGSNAPFGGHATISGVAISNATTGIYVKDNTLSAHAPVVLNVGPGVSINGGTDGLLIEGGSASVPSLNNLAFTGQTKYIRLVNSPNNVDATSATFEGLTGSAMTLAQNYATEDKIDHKIDLASLGFVKVKDLNTFVTVNSFVAPNTTASIQRGVDAASNGWTVNVNAGTFNENVLANKEVTIRGAGNTTILSPTAPCNGTGINVSANNVTIDDMQINGFNVGIFVGANSITMSDLLVSSMCNRGIELGITTDVDIINSSIVNNVVGIRAGSGATVNDLLMNNLEVHNNTQGMYIAYETAAGSPVFNDVLIQNSDFSNNTQKGMYFEKLSNAVIENIIMNNSGTDPAYNFNAGIDINLKWASYSNITIRNSEFNNVGVASGASHVESPVVITVKARDDAPSYNGIPASLSNVTIENNIVKGPQNGIRLGEFGKTNNTPTNVQIHNNDLSGPYANKALINNTPVTTDATCNWWGTVGSGGIAAMIQGPVTYSPFLVSGVDAQPATRGFQPAAACLANNNLYVNDNVLVGDHYTTAAGNDVTGTGTPAAPYRTITKAIAMAGAGDVIWVDAGLYVENPVVNKSLTIKGSNFGADARIVRPFTESIVRTNGNQGSLFNVPASGVVIDGFTLDGDDPSVLGTPVQSGADVNVSYLVSQMVTGNNLNVSNNIMKKAAIGLRGSGHASNGNIINQNWFDEIGFFDFGYAVSIRDNYYADITNNKMTKVWTGAHINNHNGTGGPVTFTMSGNEVRSYATGLAYWLNYNQATPLTVDNNQFFAETGAVFGNFGIQIVTLQDAVNPTFTNNTISNRDYGIAFQNVPTSNPVNLGPTNTVTGSKIAGVWLTDNIPNAIGTTNLNAQHAPSTVIINGINITSAPGASGIFLLGADPSNTLQTMTFASPTTVNGGSIGLDVNGNHTAITGNSINNLHFAGQTDAYVGFFNNTLSNLKIDATSSMFDGTTGAAKTNAQLFATEDKIIHTIDNRAVGFVVVKANNTHITDIATPTPTNNDYTRIKNGVEVAANNWNINLNGTFDWTEANAAAAWALGNDGTAATGDDYSIVVPANLNGVTFTAPLGLGTASIQGPGDLAGVNLEGVLIFDGGDNQGWTISNLRILDFDLSIGMFNGAGGSDAFNNTTITNNYFRLATDLNSTVAPVDVNQNIGIHYSFGANQTISNNTIDIPGNGISNAPANYSSSVGMQSNTSGGNVYNGLQITGNTINILTAQTANPETILGIWENGHAHQSNITVSNNQFLNLAGGNNPAMNLQRGFRVTSHSGAATSVTYNNNTVNGANIGMQWLAGGNFSGNQPVAVTNNFLNSNHTGILIQSSGSANVYRNTINGGSIGLDIQNGGFTSSVQENFIKNNTTDNIRVAAAAGVMGPINKNDLSGSGVFAINNQSTQTLNATCNWYGTNSAPAVAAMISGPVNYIPYLTNGTDADADPSNGFQPLDPCAPCNLTVASTSSTNASCPGSADGTATVNVTGGSGTYTYLWSDGQTTNPATGLVTGTYTVTVTDINGCTTNTSVFVDEYGNPVVNHPGNQGPLCHNSSTAPINFTSPSSTRPGVITYTWTNSAPVIGLPANGTGNIPSFVVNNPSTNVPLVAFITVTPHYTYNNVTCDGAPVTFTITVRRASNGTMTGASNTTICAGQGASINVDVNGPTNFTGSFRIREILSPIGPVFGTPNNYGPFTLTITGPQAVAIPGSYLPNTTNMPKTYRVEWDYLRDGNNCDAYPLTGFVDITVNPSTFDITCPSPITNATVNNAGCTALISTPNPTVTITCGSLASLTWSMTGATTDASPPAGINYVGTHTFNPGTTTITYTATDAGGNVRTCSFTVTVVNNLSGSISGTTTVTQGPGSTPVTFTGNGGTKPYTFTYTVSINGGPAGAPQTVSTTGGSSSVDVQQSNAVTGTYTYTLVGVTDNYGCSGTINPPNSATITIVPPIGRPDLTTAVSQPLNTTFFSGQVKEGYVTLSNVSPDPTTGTATFRISLVSNFNLEILGTTTSVNPPGGPVTPVNNTDWDITPGAFFYTISSKPGVIVNGNSSIKIGFKLTATGGSNSSGIMTVSVLDGTGGSTPANGDSNNSNNQSVKLFSIN